MSSICGTTASLLYLTQEKYATGAILLAAGNSVRMGGAVSKQLLHAAGKPILAHTLLAYQKSLLIREIVVVAREKDFPAIRRILEDNHISKATYLVRGGATRQESARNGLKYLSDGIRYVAVADGARCLSTPGEIDAVCKAAYSNLAASAAHAVTDTVKRANASGLSKETVDRKNLWQAQTPQVFAIELYYAALAHTERKKLSVTDDNAMVEALGIPVRMVECGSENLKVTTPGDLPHAEAILEHRRKRV